MSDRVKIISKRTLTLVETLYQEWRESTIRAVDVTISFAVTPVSLPGDNFLEYTIFVKFNERPPVFEELKEQDRRALICILMSRSKHLDAVGTQLGCSKAHMQKVYEEFKDDPPELDMENSDVKLFLSAKFSKGLLKSCLLN